MEYLFYFFLINCGFSLMSCVHGWTYHTSSITMNYDNARNFCRRHYTDMVAIQNQMENRYLNDTMKFEPSYYWIGIRRNSTTRNWFWIGTKKLVTHTNWATNEPNNKSENKNEDCVEMYVGRKIDSGKWNDEPCNKKKVALCYKASCSSSSCSSNGECVETINNYTCNCFEGFYGRECENVVTCPEIKYIDHGSVVCTHLNGNFTYQSSCSFTCSNGYILVGSERLQCTENGNWGNQTPHCKAIQCPHPQTLDNGAINCSDKGEMLPDQSICNFSCNEGFILVGSPSIFCESSGQWTEKSPKCEAIQCKHPEKPKNGSVDCFTNGNMLPYKSLCNFRCDDGFSLVGPSSTVCATSGQWTEKSPKCQAIQCDLPDQPENGAMNCSSNGEYLPQKSTCTFSCNEGFTLDGSPSVLCTAPGQWSEEYPKCKAIECNRPEQPLNGSMTCTYSGEMLPDKSTCNFNCSEGFRLTGSPSILCAMPGQWIGHIPKCEAVQCASMVAPENGVMKCQDGSNYKSTCEFFCAEGFQVVGLSKLQCLGSGEWTSSVPVCKAVQCESLVAPENGVMNCQDESNYKSTCEFSCAEGFEMSGSSKLQCLHSGEWTSSVPICKVVQCAAVNAPENGQMECQNGANYNSQCFFSCSKGFSLIGLSVLRCLSSGKWTSAVPKCEAVKCDALIAPSMGRINCTHPLGEFEYGSVCKIYCDSGLLLNGTNTLECDSNGNWTSTLPSCKDKIILYVPASYLIVGSVMTGASVLSAASLLICLAKRLRKTVDKFTPSSSYQHLEGTGVYSGSGSV